jgi:hypothetical protein
MSNVDRWLAQHKRDKAAREEQKKKAEMEPDWSGECENCGASPIVPTTGMCGPCTFGDADTADGNW